MENVADEYSKLKFIPLPVEKNSKACMLPGWQIS
jgi:hypothetical protein